MQGKIALEEHFTLPETRNEMSRFSLPGTGEDLKRRLTDLHDIRLGEMDKFGIELAIQSFNAPGVQAVPNVDNAIELAQRANDTLAEEVAKRPDRFAGFAALPLQDPDAACVELTRCIKELGFKGALVNGFTSKGDMETVIILRLTRIPALLGQRPGTRYAALSSPQEPHSKQVAEL